MHQQRAKNRHYRQDQAPDQGASGLGGPVSLGGRAMQGRTFGKGMPRALAAPPPLPEPRDVRVMQRHFHRQPANAPPGCPQTDAHLGLLSGNQRFAETPDGGDRIMANQHVAAHGAGVADRRVPFQVAQPVID